MRPALGLVVVAAEVTAVPVLIYNPPRLSGFKSAASLARHGRFQHCDAVCIEIGLAEIIAGKRSEEAWPADSEGSRPRIRDGVAHQSDLMSLGVPR